MTRVAIITPYLRETRYLLERCVRSVHAQTMKTDHFMVADGRSQDWIDGRNVRHIKLDRAHSDAGNAARGIGALLAVSEDVYDAIGFLDADNWLEADHVATCLAAAEGQLCDYVVAKRTLRRPDESIMPLVDNWLFDTSCLCFLRSAFYMLSQWGMIPKHLAAIGDRVFYQRLQQRRLIAVHTDHATVNYHNLWAASYRALGEELPPGAKESVQA